MLQLTCSSFVFSSLLPCILSFPKQSTYYSPHLIRLSTYMLLSEEGDKTSLHLLPTTFTFWLLCASLPWCPIDSAWNHFLDSRYFLFKYLQRQWHLVGWLELKPSLRTVAKLHFLPLWKKKTKQKKMKIYVLHQLQWPWRF